MGLIQCPLSRTKPHRGRLRGAAGMDCGL